MQVIAGYFQILQLERYQKETQRGRNKIIAAKKTNLFNKI